MSVSLSMLDRPVFGLSDSEAVTRLEEIILAERRLAAARLESIHDLCTRGVPAQRGCAHPATFLRNQLKLTSGEASRMCRLATALSKHPDVAQDLADGAISESQAVVITDAIAAMASEASAGEQAEALAVLLSQATVLTPKELEVSGQRILQHVAPQAAEERDRKHVERLERTAWEDRAFSITHDGHGRYRFRGSTTAEGAALFQAILDPLTHPNRAYSASGASGTGTGGTGTSGASGTSGTIGASGTEQTGVEPTGSEPTSKPGSEPQPESHGEPAGEPGQQPADSHPGPSHTAEPDAEPDAEPCAAPQDHARPDHGPRHEARRPSAPCDNPLCLNNLWAFCTHTPRLSAGTPDAAEDTVADAAANGTRSTISGPGSTQAFKDPRTAAQRRHDALLDACRLLLSVETLPENGGSKPQITIATHYDALTRQLTAGTLETGGELSAAEVRRFCCDAGILPAVLNSNGVPLDLGRERRLINGTLRKAVVLRDRGCSFPGCDRAPRWCQGHHIKSWSQGGPTSLANTALVCAFHHRLLHHDDGWTVHIGSDGYPLFTPPAHLDPAQIPRRNLYHQRN